MADNKLRLMYANELPADLSTVVAEDGERGCPETKWDGPRPFRCGLGVNTCILHGDFKVMIVEEED